MARKKVDTKMTSTKAIAALDKAHASLLKSTAEAQKSVIEIGRVWHLTCKTNKMKSPARNKVMEHGIKLFGKNASTYMSNAARLYQIVNGLDKDIPFTVKEANEVLESTASVNPTSLVKVLRDWYKDSQTAKTDDGETDDSKTDDGETDDGKTDDTAKAATPVTTSDTEGNRPVNAEYSTLTTDEFAGTVGRCLNDTIRRLNDGWCPDADTLSTLKQQVRRVSEMLSKVKAPASPLDKIMDKAVG